MPTDSTLNVYNIKGKICNTFVPLKMSVFTYQVSLRHRILSNQISDTNIYKLCIKIRFNANIL